MRPSIIFATAEYVKRLREECLRENKPLHRHTRFRRQELAQDEINPDVLAMSGILPDAAVSRSGCVSPR
ncbi:hypothetical protein C3997_02589 [Escherichia coli]|nr:hypothetical protein C3997_02589 [Escherichia coli]RDS25660.1 hypothetical protein C3990_02459 [Escherichia coli]